MLACGLILIWTIRKKMKYNFTREVWVIFMGDFLYLKIRKAKILRFVLNLYWVYKCVLAILLQSFDLDLY